MSLKENWTSQEKMDFNDFNQIIEVLNEIDSKLSISSAFQRTVKRHVRVGDDLSGKKLYMEFPDNLYNNILDDVAGGQGNVLLTDNNHTIIEYGNIYNSIATVSMDHWMNTLYYANIDTSEVYANLSEVQLSNDFGVITSINENFAAFNYIYLMEKETIEKQRGDFLTAEELQNLENNLEQIANAVNTSFEKRDWYYLSVITFKDINRWSILLNYAYDVVFEPSKNIITEAEEFIITEDNEYLMTEEEE